MVDVTGEPEATAGQGASDRSDERRRLSVPGMLLGLGMGGFVDGIVLHQVLQWHHMLSGTDDYGEETMSAMEVNVTADGFFHVATWAFVAMGLVSLWRATRAGGWRRTGRSLLGWMLVGWGLFNVVEGVVDHHILEIHRVRPEADNPLLWDVGFLVFGALLIAVGWLVQRSESEEAARWRRRP